ncbi:MAG: Arm DNA-binding domain-containing protein [Flectobacillus sp.]|nr:Arm DNA-binding domain-containing protein [Flectobacillus sp.]
MFQPTVTVVFNRLNYKSKSGCYPVYLRITIARKSKYLKIPLSEKIESVHWNAKGYKNDNYIKNTHLFALGLNNQIQAYKLKVRSIIYSFGLSRQITIEDILNSLENKN